jgi:hypothetical protein
LLGSNLGATLLMGAQMGLISSFPTFGTQPSKAITSSALGTEATFIGNDLPIRIIQTAPVQPLTGSANTESIVRDHIDARGEVDGVKLDMIPFVGDGEILLDDVPEPEQLPPAAKSAAMLRATVIQVKAAHTGQAVDDFAKTHAAERAYNDERDVSQLPKSPVAAKFDTIDFQLGKTKSEQSSAPPLDMVM